MNIVVQSPYERFVVRDRDVQCGHAVSEQKRRERDQNCNQPTLPFLPCFYICLCLVSDNKRRLRERFVDVRISSKRAIWSCCYQETEDPPMRNEIRKISSEYDPVVDFLLLWVFLVLRAPLCVSDGGVWWSFEFLNTKIWGWIFFFTVCCG